MPPLTVVIADAERTTRAACRRGLLSEKRIGVVREARNAMETIAAADLKPRILLLSLTALGGHGVSLLPIIRGKSPSTRVLLLTGRASEARILDALSHGAQGYLPRKILPDMLVRAVLAVDAGEAWVPRKMVGKIIERLARLTGRARGRA